MYGTKKDTGTDRQNTIKMDSGQSHSHLREVSYPADDDRKIMRTGVVSSKDSCSVLIRQQLLINISCR
jgi:hypothetical protein